MSMIGEYLRVTATELDRAIQDPDWALEFVEEVQDTEEETEPVPAEARHFTTYKTWGMLRFLLARTGFPVNVGYGEELFAEDEDWGYGPPRYLRPERVRLAAEALRATNYGQLISGVDPTELTSAEVYPFEWSEPGSRECGASLVRRPHTVLRGCCQGGQRDARLAGLKGHVSGQTSACEAANACRAFPSSLAAFTVIPHCSPLDLVRLWCGGEQPSAEPSTRSAALRRRRAAVRGEVPLVWPRCARLAVHGCDIPESEYLVTRRAAH
ncbi:YfbM family protein [Streptomyces sp. NPDC059852]|uniref:YfbM family protein n=1 Tax=Streptomyces sp. NPDC059852 TaxID=3346972 RepID=UPI003668381B